MSPAQTDRRGPSVASSLDGVSVVVLGFKVILLSRCTSEVYVMNCSQVDVGVRNKGSAFKVLFDPLWREKTEMYDF